MIVRIMGQGQWVMAPEHLLELNELDRALEGAVEAGDEPAMLDALMKLIDGVQRLGTEVPEDVAYFHKALVVRVVTRAGRAYPVSQSLEELEQWLDDHVAFGDCLLFKGSNSMGLSKAVAYMKEK